MSAAFDRFWDAVDAELAQVPMAAEVQPLPKHSTDSATSYFVRLTSIGPYRISGYLSVPNSPRPVPGMLLTPRYGSVNNVPDFHDRERYVVLQLNHRGQRLADRPFAAEYPGLLTLDIDQSERYVYRGIVADCLRGAEFLLSRPEVDSAHVGIQGDDLALLTAARRPRFSALIASELLLYRLLDAAERSDAYPVEEVNDFLRTNPELHPAVAETLELFDPRAHGPAIHAATMLPSSDDGTWLRRLRESLAGPSFDYPLTHQGAIDHDWLDAWLAAQLGAQPRARFLASV
jgi:cephalosporin-C deacetylase-like acetyl esterase